MGLMIQWSRPYLGFAVFQVHDLEEKCECVLGLCVNKMVVIKSS